VVKINKGIPMPGARVASLTLPFDQLDVGDSFFVEDKPADVRSKVSRYKRNHKTVGLSCRIVTENGVKGIRVWRTK